MRKPGIKAEPHKRGETDEFSGERECDQVLWILPEEGKAVYSHGVRR